MLIEETCDDALELRFVREHDPERDLGCRSFGESVDPGRDGGEGHGSSPELVGHRQRAAAPGAPIDPDDARDFDDAIEEALTAAKCVIVIGGQFGNLGSVVQTGLEDAAHNREVEFARADEEPGE